MSILSLIELIVSFMNRMINLKRYGGTAATAEEKNRALKELAKRIIYDRGGNRIEFKGLLSVS